MSIFKDNHGNCIAICQGRDCGNQFRVSPRFQGSRPLCPSCRKRDFNREAADRAYEDENDDFFDHVRECEEAPWDEITEDSPDLPPPTVVLPRDWVVRLDIRGSRHLSHYDRSRANPPTMKARK